MLENPQYMLIIILHRKIQTAKDKEGLTADDIT